MWHHLRHYHHSSSASSSSPVIDNHVGGCRVLVGSMAAVSSLSWKEACCRHRIMEMAETYFLKELEDYAAEAQLRARGCRGELGDHQQNGTTVVVGSKEKVNKSH
jgi:hypothetical protein